MVALSLSLEAQTTLAASSLINVQTEIPWPARTVRKLGIDVDLLAIESRVT
jgi:hypothetical protein